jgi:hypothetical protein
VGDGSHVTALRTFFCLTKAAATLRLRPKKLKHRESEGRAIENHIITCEPDTDVGIRTR